MVKSLSRVTHRRLATDEILQRYRAVRRFTAELCAPLSPEDCVIQSMEDASPTRWHLAHTSWFFENFVLSAALSDYRPFHPQFSYLFNSYYNAVGQQFPRPRRGLLSRPTVEEIYAYRAHVDRAMQDFLAGTDAKCHASLLGVVEVGIQHEQQHQELILTDIKHALSCNPLFPAYHANLPEAVAVATPLTWSEYAEGIRFVGTMPVENGGSGFCYDNETPRHRVFTESFALADRLVTSGEYLEFIEDGGYSRPELWLSAGWQTVCDEGWQAPLYWAHEGSTWYQFTLAGRRPVDVHEPVCHISYYEADALARWAGGRLPTEFELERAGVDRVVGGNFAERRVFHPEALGRSRDAEGTQRGDRPRQIYGDVWEWTSSSYAPYPGYRQPEGAIGEYNGKFMCNQYVLRGGSCATSSSHVRSTYRNFFPPAARWQFSGLRLAR